MGKTFSNGQEVWTIDVRSPHEKRLDAERATRKRCNIVRVVLAGGILVLGSVTGVIACELSADTLKDVAAMPNLPADIKDSIQGSTETREDFTNAFAITALVGTVVTVGGLVALDLVPSSPKDVS